MLAPKHAMGACCIGVVVGHEKAPHLLSDSPAGCCCFAASLPRSRSPLGLPRCAARFRRVRPTSWRKAGLTMSDSFTMSASLTCCR